MPKQYTDIKSELKTNETLRVFNSSCRHRLVSIFHCNSL